MGTDIDCRGPHTCDPAVHRQWLRRLSSNHRRARRAGENRTAAEWHLERQYIGGVLTNPPDNLIGWIQAARAINPQTVMPTTNVSEQDARDTAAYFYALN